MSDSPRTSEAGFDLDTVDRLLGTTRAVRRRLDFFKGELMRAFVLLV